jgi:hypothetical protein
LASAVMSSVSPGTPEDLLEPAAARHSGSLGSISTHQSLKYWPEPDENPAGKGRVHRLL